MDQESCKNLYQRYLELKEKTTPKLHDWESGKDMEAQHINVDDFEELKNVKMELTNCLDLLSDNELIEISEDDDIGLKAQEILRKRRG